MTGPTNFADPMKRFFAAIIDSVILSAGALLIGSFTFIPMIVSIIGMAETSTEEEVAMRIIASMGMLFLFALLYYVGVFFYYALQHSSKFQATIGKRAMKIYVTDEHGDRLTFGKSALRMVGRFINGFTMGIGYLIILFTDKKQGVHDMIAKTIVLDGTQSQGDFEEDDLV